MNLQLKQIRQRMGLSQEEMASRLSSLMECEVKVSRYGTWERSDRMMNLEQAYYCAVALGVTLNDLVGMESQRVYADRRQEAINAHFDTFNDEARTDVYKMVERMSHDPHARIEKTGPKMLCYKRRWALR